jgi:putative ABC transport system permease protein
LSTSPLSWPLIGAWRDLRSSLRASLVLCLALSIGVAVLVFSHSLGRTFQRALDRESKGLLGADLTLTLRSEFPPDLEEVLARPEIEIAREIRFRSMATFLTAERESRLVQVRALDGPFPFYGVVETEPAHMWAEFGRRGVFVDDTLLAQTGAQPGDELRLGTLTLPIVASVTRMPGESPFSGLVAPRIYIPRSLIDEAGLLGRGSIANYSRYLKFSNDEASNAFVTDQSALFTTHGVETTTVEKRREMLGEIGERVRLFFDVVGLLSMILGGVSAAAVVTAIMSKRRLPIGIMKCIGATSLQIKFRTIAYLLLLAALSTVIGSTLGILLQRGIAAVLARALRLPFTTGEDLPSILLGGVVSLGTGVAAWREMSKLHTVSPLVVFRPSLADMPSAFSPWRAAPACLLAGLAYLWYATEDLSRALIYTSGCTVAFGVLGIGAMILQRSCQHLATRVTVLPFALRQGMKNLGRPGNHTVLLIVSSGIALLGAHTVLVFHTLLTSQIELSHAEQTPNVFVYDIQPDQADGVRSLVRSKGLEIREEVPIVLMRLQSIRGRPVRDITADPASSIPAWTLNRVYWSTYRSHTLESERIVKGSWTERHHDERTPPEISIEDRLAERLGVSLGDEIVWDIHGIPYATRVGSLRQIMWERMRRNAFVVFPEGVLEDAPSFLFFTIRTKDAAETATIQREIARSFPNVSIVDIRGVVARVEELLGMIVRVAALLATTLAVTALVALSAALLAGTEDRARELSLYRTVGATRRQIVSLMRYEFLLVGVLASSVALVLSVVIAAIVSEFVFHRPFEFPWSTSLVTSAIFLATIVGLALGTHRPLLKMSPLAALRGER